MESIKKPNLTEEYKRPRPSQTPHPQPSKNEGNGGNTHNNQ